MSLGEGHPPTGLAAEDAERAAFVRIGWRLLPILVVAYLLNYIDRTNVGVAALTMNREIGLSASEFGTGAGILFLGYCLFEVPSNLLLYRIGARRWIARIMISWGLVSAATVFVTGVHSFYLLRFLLGVAEAGFFPGVTFYLASWFPARYRARILAWFLASIPVSALIGGPLSGALLRMDGVWGMAGWRWLFLLESIPCVLIGFLLLRLMTDQPEVATWLTAEQRTLVVARLRSERRVRPVSRFAPALRDIRVWVMSFIYLGFLIGAYGVQVWLPQIIKQSQFSDFTVGWLSAIPYVFAVVGMLIWATAVDQRGARIVNLTATCLLATVGFGVALLSASFVVSMVGLTVALIGVNAARAVFWAMPSRFLEGEGAAGGLALINSIGTAGGFFGPFIIGWLKELTGSFTAGLLAMAGFLLISALLAASLKLVMPGESDRERADRRF